MSMLSTNKDGPSSNGGVSPAMSSGGAQSGGSGLRDTPDAPVRSSPIPVRAMNKCAQGDHAELVSLARCGEVGSASSTSLDADDEADAGPPADTAELASTPSSAPVYPPNHRWLVESRGGDSPLRKLEPVHEGSHKATSQDARVALPRSSSTEERKTSTGPGLSTPATPIHTTALRRRKSAKHGTQASLLSPRKGSSSSDATPPSSPGAPNSMRVSLTQPPSTFALSVVSGDIAQPDCKGTGAPVTSTVIPAPHCARSEGGAGVNLSSSPPASPPSLATTTRASDFSDGSPVQRNLDTFCSPLTTHLRSPSRTSAELQQFGCCVFFFPAPLVSWLFPLIGHVAISNAEGSRLFTFESSYYVREEKLVTVLDRVLRGEMNSGGQSPSPARRGRSGLEGFVQRGGASERHFTSSPAQSPMPFRGSAMSDASTSDVGLNSPSDPSAASPAQHSASTPLFPTRSTARPPRRTGRSRSSGAAATTGHTHTRCVRIWDLKPLLMESRGRRTRRAPYSITREGGRQAAVALWERLQGLLQPLEGSSSVSSTAATGSSRSEPASRTSRRGKAEQDDSAEGVHSTTGMSSVSSSGDEENEYELLDAETAHFYNRNLNATIRLFRGSADGSNNSPDVVLQHHSSFSFVGFVLEACGIGSQAKLSASSAALAAPVRDRGADRSVPGVKCDANGAESSNPAAASTGASTTPAADSVDSDEEIHWGAVKLLFHVCIFGKWHRGEGRLRRALHGGSITSAAILWVIVFALCFHYFRVMLSF